MSTATDVVRVLEGVVSRLDGVRAQAGGAKSSIHTASGRVNALVATANGQDNLQVLRASGFSFKRAEADIDRAHDRLKEAVEALGSYLGREFRQTSGGAASARTPTGAIGSGHVEAFDRGRRRALAKQALLVGATGAVAAAGVVAFVGALTVGAPLAVALGAGVVPNSVAFAVSRIRDVHALSTMRAQGASHAELVTKSKEILVDSSLDAAGNWLFPPLGIALNMKDSVDDLFELFKMYETESGRD